MDNSIFVDVYYRLVKTEEKVISDVPPNLRDSVQAKLDADAALIQPAQ
jgi:hypothetical protein